MNDIIPTDSSGFWTMVGSIVALFTFIVGGIAYLIKLIKKSIRENIKSEFEPIKHENIQLRHELENRFRFPTYARDIIDITEKAAETKIQEIEFEYENALKDKDNQLALELRNRKKEIENLRSQISKISNDREALRNELENAIVSVPPKPSGNGMLLPTGLILVVKYKDKYGAVQAIDQSGKERGAFIKYVWWYQPNGTGTFLDKGVQTNFSTTREDYPGPSPMLEIGPIKLQWSMGGEGQGWVYFGPEVSGTIEYEIAVTRLIDITNVDATKIELMCHPKFK